MLESILENWFNEHKEQEQKIHLQFEWVVYKAHILDLTKSLQLAFEEASIQ